MVRPWKFFGFILDAFVFLQFSVTSLKLMGNLPASAVSTDFLLPLYLTAVFLHGTGPQHHISERL